jgi:hypothetical protein
MRIIKYLSVFLVGVIVGVAAIIIFYQSSKEGITLKQDTILYVGREPVANIRKGTILIRDKYTERYEFSFYLDQTEVAVHEPKDTYYMDKKIE